MLCPQCGAPAKEQRVLGIDHTATQSRRRRKCTSCGHKFSTVEVQVNPGQRTSTKEVVMLPEGTKQALTG